MSRDCRGEIVVKVQNNKQILADALSEPASEAHHEMRGKVIPMSRRNLATASEYGFDHLTDWDWVIAACRYVAEDVGITDEDIKKVEAEVREEVYEKSCRCAYPGT